MKLVGERKIKFFLSLISRKKKKNKKKKSIVVDCIENGVVGMRGKKGKFIQILLLSKLKKLLEYVVEFIFFCICKLKTFISTKKK